MTRRIVEIIWLDELGSNQQAQVGGKAATLGLLRRAGLPVPDGFCLPAQSLPALLDARSEEWERIWEAYHQLVERGSSGGHLFDGRVVVRSSAVWEDSREASYAGQYESYLDIQSEAGLREAILACEASAHSARIEAYNKHTRLPANDLAVLVQLQVSADASGVLFSRQPVSGETTSMWIEAVPGRNDALLAGRVAPARYQVDRQGNLLDGPGSGPLTSQDYQTLAGLLERIEEVLDVGQDVEWAIAKGQAVVLQARPVTQPRYIASDWTRANVGEVLPDPVTPLTWAVFQSTLLGGDLWDERRYLDENIEDAVRLMKGLVWLRLRALLDSFCYLPAVTPQVVRQVLGVQLPSGMSYRRPTGLKVHLAQGLFVLDLSGLVPRLAWMENRLGPIPPASLDNLDGLVRWIQSCFQLHLKTTAYTIGAYGLIEQFLTDWLPGETDGWLPKIMKGHEHLQTAAQGRQLWQLAETARKSPQVARLLVKPLIDWDDIAQKLAKIPEGRKFRADFYRFLAENGARAAGEFELAVPRWREDPTFVLQVLSGYLSTTKDIDWGVHNSVEREQAVEQVRSRLSPLKRVAFNRLLAGYTRYTTMRENVKYQLMEGFARLRGIFLREGERLAAQGWIETAEDIFYLTPPEIRQAQEKKLLTGFHERISTRRESRQHWLSLTHRESGGVADGSDHQVSLSGIATSPGMASGLARVLMDPAQAGELREGEILVAPHTDPGWTPLFLSCGGVVTETGGFLSHGATVAREYGVPCVVNVAGATRHIQTGDWVQVDGTRGQITILKESMHVVWAESG